MKRPSFFSKKSPTSSPAAPSSPKRKSWGFRKRPDAARDGGGGASPPPPPPPPLPSSAPAPARERSNSRWHRHGSAILSFASARRTSAALLSIRHATGYDDLEKAMQVERGALLRELARTKTGEPSAKVRRDFREKMRSMLLAHTGAMREEGLVFEHTFEKARLGMQIALARYGDEGREFIQIDGTEPFCDL